MMPEEKLAVGCAGAGCLIWVAVLGVAVWGFIRFILWAFPA